ncbi:hypothetical protein ABH992_003242 [Bradyrhizobium yuanmingense]|uniref:Uncharacterized protein n=1 Tax=Bradyrhizobium yuanmingense TaxID=108015 RepID=A0ABV4GIU1_9BRAD
MERPPREPANRKSESLTQTERELIEQAKARLRTVKEQINRVEFGLDEYSKNPSGKQWRWMMQDLELLANAETVPVNLVKSLRHAGLNKSNGGWPPGTQNWSE